MASKTVLASAIIFFAFMAMAIASLLWYLTDYYYTLEPLKMA